MNHHQYCELIHHTNLHHVWKLFYVVFMSSSEFLRAKNEGIETFASDVDVDVCGQKGQKCEVTYTNEPDIKFIA